MSFVSDQLPQIDISGLRLSLPAGERWSASSAAVESALISHGCFDAIYPSLSTDLRHSLFEQAVPELFALPLESKLRNTSDEPYQGYIGRIPSMAYESLRIDAAASPAAVEGFTRLMWPQGNSTFRDAVVGFAAPLQDLVGMVHRMILESLGIVEEECFDAFVGSVSYGLRLSEYGVPPDQETEVGMGSHVDPNFVTVVCQNGVGGLQVETREGDWVDVVPSPDSVTVMIGQAFQGCDGSVLLDDTATLVGEKTASQNVNSLIGFDIVDRIKNQLEGECPGVVSCADLLAIAARDAVILVGGPYWDVPVGRKDSMTASLELANTDIPTPNQNLVTLISMFLGKGLSVQDMVALVGSHTIGMARCLNFRDRIYGDFEATSHSQLTSQAYLSKLQSICPESGHDNKISPMDYVSPNNFDSIFFESLLKGEGLLNSDQEMYSSLIGYETADLVKTYASDSLAFFSHFSDAMVKMGNITNPEGGQVRKNCRFVNS